VKNYKLGAKTMPTVESAVHLGIIRTTSLTENMTINHRHLYHQKNKEKAHKRKNKRNEEKKHS
jgi:hypothetical protein